MKLALLTCQGRPELVEQEQSLAHELSHYGHTAQVCIWNDPEVDWTVFDCLVFRTIWDYYQYPEAFAAWLEKLAVLNIRTLNPLNIIRYNQHKFYLRDLQDKGVLIIPTVFIPKGTVLDLTVLVEKQWEKAVIKPAVSAGSYLTKLFAQSEITETQAEYAPIVAERDLLLQPFMPEIQEQGEVSLLFFNGQFSHAVVKTPKLGDFRIQSQFGGLYRPFEPTLALVQTAMHIVSCFDETLLYARVDGIIRDGQLYLMEVELIEPDLYFDYHPEARARFVQSFSMME